MSDQEQRPRPAFVGHDRYNGVILRIGERVFKLGKGNDVQSLAEEIAARWNDAESVEPYLRMDVSG
jgi:hypothetical protein